MGSHCGVEKYHLPQAKPSEVEGGEERLFGEELEAGSFYRRQKSEQCPPFLPRKVRRRGRGAFFWPPQSRLKRTE